MLDKQLGTKKTKKQVARNLRINLDASTELKTKTTKEKRNSVESLHINAIVWFVLCSAL